MTATARDEPGVLFELFSADARTAAANLRHGIALISDGGVKPDTVLADLLSAVRSVRSAARIVALEAAARVAVGMEQCLLRVQQQEEAFDTTLTSALLAGAEVIDRMGAAPAASLADFGAQHAEQLAAVVRALDGQLEPAGPVHQAPRLALATRHQEPTLGTAPDAGLLALFKTEAESCVAALNSGLIQLESGSDASLDALMRAAHSFKGALRVVGFVAATRLAHALEDCFVSAQQGTLTLSEHHIDALLKAVDLFSELAHCPVSELPNWHARHAARADALAATLLTLAQGAGKAALGQPNSPLSQAPIASPAARAAPLAPDLKEAAPAAPGSKPAGAGQGVSEERVLRVTASSVNRLMGLAGESLVESRRGQALASTVLRLKRRQTELGILLEKLDTTLGNDAGNGAGVMAEARARTLECRSLLADHLAELEAHARRSDDLSDRLYREALKSRMRPFRDGVQGLPRVARDVARQLGKKVRLEIAGEGTDVDRDVLESLEAPLNHLLRNAIDHGLETPAERVSKGKPELGVLRVVARHHAGMLAITVSDDGAGIDPEKLRTKIVERRLLGAEVAARLSSAEVLEFIFLPGFSTAREVTEISGRGVGLDAVKTAVEAASGTVRVTSEPGKGTQFLLQLPVTRSVLRAVVVEVAGEPYAFPLLRIEQVLRLAAVSVKSIGSVEYAVVNGENVALISAQQVLGLGHGADTSDEVSVVVIGDPKRRYGLVVDKFLGEHDLVVRPLDPRLGKVQDLAAAAILIDGAPALIVDVEDMVRSIEKLAQSGRIDRLGQAAGPARPRKRLLVVDDSITVREAERQLLVNRGYDVAVAVDGVDGYNSVQSAEYDLLIVDIDMPRMNGIDLVRTIRQDSRHAALPIVIVSYKDRDEDRMRGLEAGANQYLTKSSFHDDTLVHVVEDLIGAADA